MMKQPDTIFGSSFESSRLIILVELMMVCLKKSEADEFILLESQ